MISPEVSQYVSGARAQGVSDDAIKQQLMASGWGEADINEALGGNAMSQMPVTPATPSPAAAMAPATMPTGTAGSVQVSNQTLMAILAYFGILIVIPFFTDAKNDPLVKFHLKQGLVLIISEVAVWILFTILTLVGLGRIISLLYFLFELAVLVLVVIGILNAYHKQQKPLPVIGKFASMFTF